MVVWLPTIEVGVSCTMLEASWTARSGPVPSTATLAVRTVSRWDLSSSMVILLPSLWKRGTRLLSAACTPVDARATTMATAYATMEFATKRRSLNLQAIREASRWLRTLVGWRCRNSPSMEPVQSKATRSCLSTVRYTLRASAALLRPKSSKKRGRRWIHSNGILYSPRTCHLTTMVRKAMASTQPRNFNVFTSRKRDRWKSGAVLS